jgi:5-methylcytosine-specific restriction endonuclease McrA
MLPGIYKKIPYRVFLIDSIELYERATRAGFKPLLDWRHFYLPIDLRRQLQYKLFGKNELGQGGIIRANDLFYHYCYENAPAKVCEECQTPLDYYSAKYVSHIKSRGSSADLAHDPRNQNLLCPRCHNNWETKPKALKIYTQNLLVIDLLNYDYQFNK